MVVLVSTNDSERWPHLTSEVDDQAELLKYSSSFLFIIFTFTDYYTLHRTGVSELASHHICVLTMMRTQRF